MTPGSDAVLAAPTAANITSGPGRQSHCEAYRAVIEAKLEAQLHAKPIWQDLVDEHGFEHSYVKESALKAKTFDCLRDVNVHLRRWEQNVADKRIHGAGMYAGTPTFPGPILMGVLFLLL